MSRKERWAILGGGLMGLALAYRLAPKGCSISVFEASAEWGGLAASQVLDGVVWDRFYHVILSSDLRLRRLLSDLGLEHQLRWTRTKTGFYSRRRFFPMSSGLDYLRYPLLSPAGKLRMALTLLSTSRRTDVEELESVGVEEYLRRASGDRVFETVWQPLLIAKLGENYRKVSAAFIWSVIRRLMAARRAGIKEELLGYIPGGYARILSVMLQSLGQSGVYLQLQHRVTAVRALPSRRLKVQFEGGRSEEFDRVIATFPSPSVAAVCGDLTDAELEALRTIEYQGIVCLVALLRQPLTECYLTYITDPGTSLTGVVEMSNLVEREQFGGRALLYLPKYVHSQDPLLDAPDDDIRARFLCDLQRLHPDFSTDEVICSRVTRERQVFALPVPGYSRKLPPMHTSVQGLTLLNSSYILNGTQNAEEVVGLVEDYVRTC
jgi:protoporphyrinogen oxidase